MTGNERRVSNARRKKFFALYFPPQMNGLSFIFHRKEIRRFLFFTASTQSLRPEILRVFFAAIHFLLPLFLLRGDKKEKALRKKCTKKLHRFLPMEL